MRIQGFRVWFAGALQQGVGAVRRAGFAVSRKVRAALGKIEATSLLDDEDDGRGGSRAWFRAIEETVEKLKKLFEQSTFVRLSRLENFFRELVGLPPRMKRALPPPAVTAPKKRDSVAPAPKPLDTEAAARYRAQVQMQLIQANTRGNAALPRKSEPPPAGAVDPKEPQS